MSYPEVITPFEYVLHSQGLVYKDEKAILLIVEDLVRKFNFYLPKCKDLLSNHSECLILDNIDMPYDYEFAVTLAFRATLLDAGWETSDCYFYKSNKTYKVVFNLKKTLL